MIDTGTLNYSADLWFEDGDIVLKAENTLFRVTQGILVYHSHIFMQMVLQAPATTLVDGCRLLEMTGDKAVDLTHFLKAVHDPAYYDPSQDTPFEVISGILRISTKYNANGLRLTCVRHLQRIFPASLEDWDNRSEPGNDTVQKFRARTLAVISLALETDHPVLLPSAMAYSWSIGLEGLLDGVPSNHSFPKTDLDWPTKRQCIIARDRLTLAIRTDLLAFMLKPAHCGTMARCNHGRLASLKAWGTFFATAIIPTPFRFEVNWTDLTQRMCTQCVEEGRTEFLSARWVLWERLPSFFGLDDWDSLQRKAGLDTVPT